MRPRKDLPQRRPESVVVASGRVVERAEARIESSAGSQRFPQSAHIVRESGDVFERGLGDDRVVPFSRQRFPNDVPHLEGHLAGEIGVVCPANLVGNGDRTLIHIYSEHVDRTALRSQQGRAAISRTEIEDPHALEADASRKAGTRSIPPGWHPPDARFHARRRRVQRPRPSLSSPVTAGTGDVPRLEREPPGGLSGSRSKSRDPLAWYAARSLGWTSVREQPALWPATASRPG